MDFDRDRVGAALSALGEQLRLAGERYELVVIGGSGLLALGLIDRTTRDVDLVALRREGELIDPRPLPQSLLDARDRVADDFGLPRNWLNAAPSGLLDFGLPAGFADRLERRDYGLALTVWLASRLDQIHFKLYALADQAPIRRRAASTISTCERSSRRAQSSSRPLVGRSPTIPRRDFSSS